MEYEYMRALRQRFFSEPDVMMQREIEEGWRRLLDRVSKEDQKRIPGLVDLQEALLEETALASFVSGFQLALGIAGELKPYSFARDEEAMAEGRREYCGKAKRMEKEVSASERTDAGRGDTQRAVTR